MKRMLIVAIMAIVALTVAGCGDGGSSPPPTIVTQILSDPTFDGDIAQDPLTGALTITQGKNTQGKVFAGIDPVTKVESRAFLDFFLRGVNGVPANASIVSATLDIVLNNIIVQPPANTIPIRIELVFFQPPILQASDFDRAILLPLTFVTITPPISGADVGNSVAIDVTPLMAEAQFRGLDNFQIRILEDLGPVSPGLIEINDTNAFAPLLEVSYF